jgi:integrase
MWSCFDLEGGVLKVHWQRTTTRDGVVEKEPKGKSKRAVALGPVLVAALRAACAERRSRRIAVPPPSLRRHGRRDFVPGTGCTAGQDRCHRVRDFPK